MNQTGYYSPEEIKKRDDRNSRWLAHRQYQDWQAAMTMNLIFGDNYVEVPLLPEGYEDAAARWLKNQSFKKSSGPFSGGLGPR